MRFTPRPLLLLVAAAAVAATACDFEFTAPDTVEVATVRVRVTGGIAGADYTFEVASQGHVTGVECVNGCDFAPGDTLLRLTPAQQDAFLEAVNASGLPTAGRPVDFGTECCDQFTFRVTYSSGREIRTFVGGLESFPGPLRTLVQSLHRYYEGAPPVIMRQLSGLEGFQTDPVAVRSARVDGDVLVLELEYGGGCAVHDVDAVAWTGWMESAPVQLGIAVTHDDHADPCDALVRPTLSFDLAPVRFAYAAAYQGGSATVLLRVAAAGSSQVVTVPFTF